MLKSLFTALRGTFMVTLLSVNTVFWATPIYLIIVVKLFTPVGTRARDLLSHTAAGLAQNWAVCNTAFVDWFLPTRWDVRIDANIDPKGQYLVSSNHQSWNDIVVLMKAFGRRAPFFKFFLKQELIWVPVLGLVWWGLDYPFMKRYPPSKIKKNPALKGKDLETTRRACARFRNQPGLVLNFLEGTRFSVAKRDNQQSPYRNLLRPKSGGFAFALSALGERLNSLLDVTIVYPEGSMGMWGFLSGELRTVIVEVRQLTVPHEFFVGSYENDPEFRKRFSRWLAQLWIEKDARINAILAAYPGETVSAGRASAKPTS